ncbi:MAG: hypothetical protein KKG59_01140 [Nanoarchaeota archaeon]|nr:hypothetical protein [Nanoarchaeota archaeon]
MNQCVRCRGRRPKEFCGKDYCPLLAAVNKTKNQSFDLKQDFFGKSPNVFVGMHNYPNVSAGIIGSEFATEKHDNPRLWAKEDYDIENVLNLRTSLVNSRFKTNVKSFNTRLNDISKEISMASKPVEMEVNLEKKPNVGLKLSNWTAPTGPSVALKKARITANPKIPLLIDKTVDDSDLKSGDAIKNLYKRNIDENQLTKLISVGNLGLKTQRRMVPTRWSITAVDDTLGKDMIKTIKDHDSCDYQAFFGGYLGNYYLILLFPDVWSYELFETYMPKTAWQNVDFDTMTDYEGYAGRREYADETAGGYYAARLAILEQLKCMKRQASVLALRFITEEYYAPLGVWVVRSASRKAMAGNPTMFESKKEMLDYSRKIVKKRFGFDLDRLITRSILLKQMREQKKLGNYF